MLAMRCLWLSWRTWSGQADITPSMSGVGFVGLRLANVTLHLAVEGDGVVVVVEELVDVGVRQSEVVDAEDGGGVRPGIELDLLEVRNELRVVGQRVLLVLGQPLLANRHR